MGFFDTIRSSFDFGNGRNDTTYYTNSLGRKMGFYWIDPNGQFYVHDDNACWQEERLYPGHPDYNHEFHWKNLSYTLSGQRGTMRLFEWSGYLDISEDKSNRGDSRYSIRVELKNGRIIAYDDEETGTSAVH